MREGKGLIASNACIGPIPLRCDFLGLRGTGPMHAGKLGGGLAFALCAREGFDCFQCMHRTDPAPLRFFGLRGTEPSLAGKLGGGCVFGVPQRGTAYQPGVKPRVWRTTGAF